MLNLQEATKEYTTRGNTVSALDHATIEINKGEFVAIVGSSGSGKSTLLLMLGGMLSPSSGKVLIDGESLYDLDPDSRATLRSERIGFVFQTFNLIPYLTALENVQVPLMLADTPEDLQEGKARQLLIELGLGDRLDHKPSELSVGQQQRVAMARTMANDPTIILADEPTGNLDPETSESIMAFLESIHAKGSTVVMVTHDPQSARRAGRTLTIENGRVLAPEIEATR